MAEDALTGARLIVDDPTMFLDERGNPKQGRKLIYRLPDETALEINVSMSEYKDPAGIRAKLLDMATSHKKLSAL
jgi:hypothetical protein